MLGIAGPKPGSSVHRESGLSPRCDSTSQGTSEENTVDSDLGDSHASTAGLDLGPVMGQTPHWLGAPDVQCVSVLQGGTSGQT